MAFKDWLKEYRETQGSQTTSSTKPSTATSTTPKQTTSGSTGSGSSGFSFRDSLKEYRENQATISLQGWSDSGINLIKELQDNSSNWYDDSQYKAWEERFTKLLGQADSWRKQYAGNQEAISYIDSVVEELSKAKSLSYNNYQYFSQWETKDQYDFWQNHNTVESRQQWYDEQQKRLEELKAQKDNGSWFKAPSDYEAGSPEYMDAESKNVERLQALNDEIASIETEIRNYERGNYNEYGQYYGNKTLDDYHAVTERPDFAITSANRDYVNPTMEELWAYDASATQGSTALSNGGSFDEEGNIRDIKGNIVQYANGPEIKDKLGLFLSAGEEGIQEAYNHLSADNGIINDTWVDLMREGDANGWKHLDDTEIAIYYALLDDSQEAAYKFLDDMSTELTKRETLARQAEIEEAPVLEQIALNIASIPGSVIGGGIAFVDDAINVLQGEEINPYSRAHAMQNAATAIRQDTAKDINNLTGNAALPWVGTTFGDVYQSLMSAGDTLLGTALGGTAYGVLMGMGAASSEAKRLYEQGASMGQMAAGGILAGAAEMVFEKLSIDKLINMKDAKSVSQVIRNLLVQGGIEASEEMATEIANTITNVLVMGNQSDWVDLETFAKNVVNAGIGGFISGGFSGGLSSAVNYGQYNQQAQDTGKTIMGAEGGLDALKSLAMEVSGADSKLAKQAGKVTGETVDGKGLKATVKNNRSQRAVGKLYDSVRTEVTKQNQADIAKSLEEGGFSAKSAKNIASAIIAKANGEELSNFQKSTLEAVKDNKKVEEIVNGILQDANSSVNKRNLNLAAYSVGINMGVGIAPSASRTSPAQAGEEIASGEGNLSSKAKVISEGNYEVSGDGSTTIAGQKVTLDKFRKTDDGTVVVATTDNQTADPSDVTYSSKGQALVYENYANIETTTNNPVIANMDLDSRSALAKAYDPASGVDAKVYFLASNQAYWYGYEGMSMTEKTLPSNSLVTSITKEQRDHAYSLGRKAGKAAAATQSAGIQAAYEKAVDKLGGKEAAKAVAKRNKGEVVLEDNIKLSSMTKQQRGSVQLAKVVAEATGVNVHIYHGTKEYGKYNTTTGEVWLNVNAMFTGQSMMAFTLGHELVHLAKQWSPAEFKEFADYLLEKYGEKGVSVEALIQAQIANAKDNGYELNEHEAYEEVIADACQRMLLDSDAVQKMAAYKAQNPTRWQQIIDAIKEFIDKIRSLFVGAEPDSAEAALYKEFDDAIKENLEKKFVDMIMDAGEHMSTIRNAFGKGTVVEVNENGEFTLAKGEVNGATKFLYNDYTWENGGRETLAAALKAEGFTKEDIDAALTIMDGKHNLVKDLAKQFPEQDRINNVTITTDLKDGHSVLSALVSNGDYPVNIDLLMVCKKRKAYQRVINRLCETGMIQQATVDALAIAEINKILGKYGFETACLGCFVESRRLRIQEWAQTIVKEWNAEVKKRNPNAKAFGFGKGEAKLTQDEVMQLIGELESGGEKNEQGNLNLGQGSAVKRMGVLLDKVPSLRRTLAIEDLITPDSLSSLRRFDSNLFSMVKSRYGSNSPKFVQEFNPYNHELAMYGKVPTEYKSLREYLYAIGGARMQSFSDFIIENWFDYCQIVADLAARKLPMHTYTKEIALVKLFGLTGIKINMSLIPDIDRSLGKDYAGLTFNEETGEYELIWADKDRFKATGGKSYMQSINFADAVALQNDPRYSGNIGTIAVGISDKHILMMLDDNRIRMIIPYHSSGMNPIFADLMGTSFYKDYTNFQNTTVKQIYNSKGQKVSLKLDKTQTGKLTSGFQFNEVLQELGDARAAAQAYKDWCADASKHTITIKGETYTAELTPKFDDFSDHENYYKLLEDFNTYDCISEQAAPQGDVQQNYPEDFDKILTDELKSQEGHRQKQTANQAFDKAMGEIETYLKSHTKADTVFYAEQHGIKISAKDKKLGAEDKKKLADLRKGMKMSMPKVDAEGNQLSVEQQEYFKSSVVRDADGKLLVMYHGTANGGAFTVFEGDKLSNRTLTSQIGQGFYFTNSKKDAEAYTQNVDIYGRTSAGKSPHLHQVYLNITNPFNVDTDTLDLEKVKSVYMDGTYDWFFTNHIPHQLNNRTLNGKKFTKAEIQAMSKAEKVSAYVDYQALFGNKNVLSKMVEAFPYNKQGELLASMRNRLGYDGVVEEFKPGLYQYVAFSSEQIKSIDNKTPTVNPDIRYSMPKVQAAPTYEELVAKDPIAVIDVGQNDEGLSYAELKEKVLENAEKNKVFEVPHPNRDTKVLIFLTQKSFTHAFSNLTKDFGEDTILAMDHISEIIHEAVLTHIAPPKNPRKAEARVFTFFAAIESERGTEPVKLTVKEYVGQKLSEIPVNIRKYFEENGAQETHNRLYDAEVLEVIAVESAKKELGASASVANRKRLGAKGTPNSTIKIADLLGLVNGDAEKYIPKPDISKNKAHNANGVSSRQLLANAFDDLAQTPNERKLMAEYRNNITKVEEVQERLKKLRGEIRMLTNANGDKNKIATMNKTAADLADLIDKYDRKLLELEASKPLRDVLARAKSAAYQEAKKRSEETMKEYRQQVSERFDRGVEGRRKTEMRQKIRKVIRGLDKILNRGDKKRNVKEDMKDFVAEALSSAEVLFTDNYSNEDIIRNGFGVELSKEEAKYAEEVRKYMAELANLPSGSYEAFMARQEAEEKLKSKIGYRMSMLKDAFSRERQRLNKTEVAEVLSKLADAYAKLETSEYAYVNGAYHEAVYGFLKQLQEDVGGAKVKDMTLGQLEELHKAYTMVLTTVRNANKMFAEDLKQSRDELANRVMVEVHDAGGEHGLWTKGQLSRNQASWNNTKPIYAAERTGSNTFVKLVNGLFKGQYGWATDMAEAKTFRQQVADKYGFKDWDMEKLYKFTSSSGIEFELNLNHIMSLYAYAKREQAHDHLLKGGFVFGKNTEVVVNERGIKRTYLNKSAKAHNISDEIMGEIISKLSKEQKSFVDEMQDYLSTTMGGKGNDVSMKLYGVKLFMEKFYFPLKSAGQFKEKAKEAELKQQQGQISIVNSGFTKAVTPKASNPVVLDGFTDVWAGHVNEMSLYHSMVLPMEDFRRVYNYASPTMEGQEAVSVNSIIENAYGDAATGYFDQLYKELNGGAIVDPRENLSKQMIGKFKKSAVMLSNSVWVQQFSAIGRALALVDINHFVGAKVDKKRHAALWNEMKQYAPVTIIKEMGGFDTHTGMGANDYLLAEEYGKGERAKAFINDKQYRNEKVGFLPAWADEVTWCAIWEAVKRETKANNKDMDVKSEEFLKKAGERFSEVIEKTQVYDSVLARSANMRSKQGLMQMLTAFMAEPTTTVNMVEDALRKGDKKTIARTFGAVAASVIINNVLASLVYSIRDDDEEETWLEKYAQAFTSGMLDDLNPITYYPILKDIWSLFQGYDIERSDMAIYSDIADAVKKAVTLISKYDSDMDEEDAAEYRKKVADALLSLLNAGAAAFGVPMKNVVRDLASYFNVAKLIKDGGGTTWRSLGEAVGGSALDSIPVVGLVAGRSEKEKLYDAIIEGDTEYVNRVKGGYESDTAYSSALRKALRENDPRIREAAIAWNANDLDEYMRIAREIIAEKHFVQDDVVMAIRTEAAALAPDEGTSDSSKAKGLFTAEKFAEAIAQGDQAMANAIKVDIIQTAQKNGKTEEEAEKSFASTAKGDLKELFAEGSITEAQAISALTTYCGDTQEEAEERVGEWVFEKDYGFKYSDRGDAYMSGEISAQELKTILMTTEGKTAEEADLQIQAYDWEAQGYEKVTAAAVRDYNEHCATANVPKDIYLYIRSFANNTENDVDENGKSINYSAMKKIMAEINAQYVLTAAQKDAIARSLGWAEKNIKKYKTW